MNNLSNLITNKAAIEAACKMSSETQRKIIILATEAAINDSHSRDIVRLNEFSRKTNLKIEQLLDLIGLFRSIVRVFMESDVKQFKETMRAVGFPEAFIQQFPLTHDLEPVPPWHHARVHLERSHCSDDVIFK